MLNVLRVHLPSDIPIVGCELTPYVQLRRPDKTQYTDDVPESAPLDGNFLRYKWSVIFLIFCIIFLNFFILFLPSRVVVSDGSFVELWSISHGTCFCASLVQSWFIYLFFCLTFSFVDVIHWFLCVLYNFEFIYKYCWLIGFVKLYSFIVIWVRNSLVLVFFSPSRVVWVHVLVSDGSFPEFFFNAFWPYLCDMIGQSCFLFWA